MTTMMGFISVLMGVTCIAICDMRVLMEFFDWIVGFKKVSHVIKDR